MQIKKGVRLLKPNTFYKALKYTNDLLVIRSLVYSYIKYFEKLGFVNRTNGLP